MVLFRINTDSVQYFKLNFVTPHIESRSQAVTTYGLSLQEDFLKCYPQSVYVHKLLLFGEFSNRNAMF